MIEIKKNKFVTQQELSKSIKINEKNIRNNILKLKEKGILKRVGPDRGGHWEIVGKIEDQKEHSGIYKKAKDDNNRRDDDEK